MEKLIEKTFETIKNIESEEINNLFNNFCYLTKEYFIFRNVYKIIDSIDNYLNYFESENDLIPTYRINCLYDYIIIRYIEELNSDDELNQNIDFSLDDELNLFNNFIKYILNSKKLKSFKENDYLLRYIKNVGEPIITHIDIKPMKFKEILETKLKILNSIPKSKRGKKQENFISIIEGFYKAIFLYKNHNNIKKINQKNINELIKDFTKIDNIKNKSKEKDINNILIKVFKKDLFIDILDILNSNNLTIEEKYVHLLFFIAPINRIINGDSAYSDSYKKYIKPKHRKCKKIIYMRKRTLEISNIMENLIEVKNEYDSFEKYLEI